jgi:Asp-tRNA(Asn)/Glu-tRNA(Gln) amidotransferase A subunit family amidase
MIDDTRRRFLAFWAGTAAAGTLLPGVLWAQVQQSGQSRVTLEMLKGALGVAGVTFTEDEQKEMLQGLNRYLSTYDELRALKIPNDVQPPLYFSALVPGMKVNRTREPLRFSVPVVRRPANLEDVAFWPVTRLAQLLRTRRVTSVELTKMYLDRLHQHNGKLNCVVTFLDDLALAQAKLADAEIAAGKHRGPLHGIPWGAKDIIAVKGFKTTWGSGAYQDQVIDQDASIVEMLREAGAVLLAKLASGELAQGDRWFGGQTKNPWNLEEGSSGSSAGPGAATAAGLCAFAIGTETSGSILSPSARCGVTGLRPTFGRISRHGVMALAWTQDRLGPMCRYAEDCAVVMSAIAKPDQRDLSVSDVPFNWNTHLDIRRLRVGYLKDAFAEANDPAVKTNQEKTLAQVEALGVKLIEVKVPAWTLNTSLYAVESAAFFDELIRTGGDRKMTTPARAAGWKVARAIPAVEFVQLQRARMMMMMKLAEATADVDVYLAPSGSGGLTQRHFTMANAACYPALNVPNGFGPKGSPTSVTFMARPFGEAELLALGKAYQDAARFHERRPDLG